MITLEVTVADKFYLQRDLSTALVNLSNGRLNKNQADNLAEGAIKNLDFKNSALAHKGVNWFARKIINVIDFEALACRA